jgi:UDP-glucose:(heptosyl)LPS alpha-1,3-glucosyltransferase
VRVALIVERFEPAGGGVEGAAWQAAHGLAAAGDEVLVVARRASASPAVRTHPVRVPATWQPLRVLAFSRAAARAAPRDAFDVVLSYSRTRHQDMYRAGGGSHADHLARRYQGAALLLRRLSPRHRVLLALERRIFADASQRVVCTSRLVRDDLERRHGIDPARLFVIPNGVDLARFDPARRAALGPPLRAALGAGEAPVWLFLGSGWERKGLDTALRAIAAGGPSRAVLWVAGRDETAPWRGRARALGVVERVRFLGVRTDPEALLAAADALVLPTRYDAFANASLEAAASGIPVVTSAANGAAEILGEGALVVADAEDAPGFAAALDALAEPATRRARGAAARRAAERHGWPVHVSALRALCERVAENRRERGARA